MQTFRLKPDLAARLDAYQVRHSIRSRGAAVVALITAALDADAQPAAKPSRSRPATQPTTPPPARQPEPQPGVPGWMARGFTSGKWR